MVRKLRMLLMLTALLLGLAALFGRSAETESTTAAQMTTVTVSNSVLVDDVKPLGINIGAPDRYGAAQYLKNIIHNPGFEAGEFASIIPVGDDPTGSSFQHPYWNTDWNGPPDASNPCNGTVAGIGQPEGFWDDAYYQVLLGPAAGRSGTIDAHTFEPDEFGTPRHTFDLGGNGAVPNPYDSIMVRRAMPGYQTSRRTYDLLHVADTNRTRPGSSGSQSLKLLPPADPCNLQLPSLRYFLDTYWVQEDTSANGPLLDVEGDWHFEVWARAQTAGDTLNVCFRRDDASVFLNETVPLTTSWEKYEWDFNVSAGADGGNARPEALTQSFCPGIAVSQAENSTDPVLIVELSLESSGDPVWVDDMAVYSTEHTNPTVFTDNFVARLKELNPGILRDWGNQLGNSLDNQLADPFARKTTNFRPQDSYSADFHYSLHEFLDLAREVGAEPWYVMPPTLTDAELENLVAYLVAPISSNHPYALLRQDLGRTNPWINAFDTIHLEFGNEMWGNNVPNSDPFAGATVNGGTRLGELVENQLGTMRAAPFYNANRLNLIVGGQHRLPNTQKELERLSDGHDTIALAPYFGYGFDFDACANNNQLYRPWFAMPQQEISPLGRLQQSFDLIRAEQGGEDTELAIYEYGLHTTDLEGCISENEDRNSFVVGLNGGLTYPLGMLTYLRAYEARNQAAFQAVQYSVEEPDNSYVRLWGMLRDLEATGLKRPTWLGLEVVNRAIQGDMITTSQAGTPTWNQAPMNGIVETITVPFVQSFAFRDGDQYSLVLFNLHLNQNQPVTFNLPGTINGATQHLLTANNIWRNNETTEQVKIETTTLPDFSDGSTLTLPKHSIVVLTWENGGPPPPTETPTPSPSPTPSPTPVPTFNDLYLPVIRLDEE